MSDREYQHAETVHAFLKRVTLGPAFPIGSGQTPILYVSGFTFDEHGHGFPMTAEARHMLTRGIVTIVFVAVARDSLSGDRTNVMSSVDARAFDEEYIARVVYRLLREAVLHELNESYRVDGKLVHDPHGVP